MKKAIIFIIILSMLCTLNVSAASLKTPKLQSFTTGATEFENTTISISNGVALATEHDPKNKNYEYGWISRVILIDYEKGTKKILPYDGARIMMGNYGKIAEGPTKMVIFILRV